MSLFDPRSAERALINDVNRVVRHCRIGKIKWKHPDYKPLVPPHWKQPYIDMMEWWERPYAPTIASDRTTPVSASPRIGEVWC